MTDLEISKALALAIGWEPNQIRDGISPSGRPLIQSSPVHFARPFDYRDWNVIGPIAEKFDCFPYQNTAGHWVVGYHKFAAVCHTPQEAIAQAVIAAKGGNV